VQIKNNIVAVIQARMGAERLPGKVLMHIADKPMLWHVIDRVSKSVLITHIVVATTSETKDDAIARFCDDNDFNCFRGSEKDVLDRYYRAADAYDADAIVRITGDCPFIDPGVTDGVIKAYLDDADTAAGASNIINRTYPRGLDTEVVSFATLERCWEGASKPYQREHVLVYIYEHQEIFSIRSVEGDVDLSGFRWTVDLPEDMQFVRKVYEKLYLPGKIFLTEDILVLLEKEPLLKEINSRIEQKSIK
jgi:spore coat polysaccharide biosynthesis protein SpsF